jgi:hypothetical protein
VARCPGIFFMTPFPVPAKDNGQQKPILEPAEKDEKVPG